MSILCKIPGTSFSFSSLLLPSFRAQEILLWLSLRKPHWFFFLLFPLFRTDSATVKLCQGLGSCTIPGQDGRELGSTAAPNQLHRQPMFSSTCGKNFPLGSLSSSPSLTPPNSHPPCLQHSEVWLTFCVSPVSASRQARPSEVQELGSSPQ